MTSDERFALAHSDPRFMEAPKRQSKVEIDPRFSHVLTDARFISSNAPVDKRGKPRNKHKKATVSSLKHFYRLQPQQEEDENLVSPIHGKKHGDIRVESHQIGHESESESDESNETLEDDDEDGQSFDESSSSSTTDSDSDSQLIDEEENEGYVQEDNVPEIDEETRRLAVVNLDWSQVRAVDLYVLLSSFLPKGGQILSVAVYPSEFGLKRMEEEAVRGPVGLFDVEEEEEHDGEDDEIDNKKLRAYELSRLSYISLFCFRYYYAVVECDSSATADYLYKTCDGVEFERSANKLDLRFIPDSLEFKHQPRDVATEAPADYEGLDFQTRALQHSNIHLTWDEDEPQRAKTLKRKLNDEQLAELELKEFLASDGSETDDDDNSDGTEDLSVKKCKKRDKYRALIQSGDGSDEEEDNDQDMEVTFNSGLEDLSKRILEKKDKESETVWEGYLRKRKEKRKASKKGSKYSSEDSSSSDGDQELAEQPDDFFVEEPSDTGNKGHPVRSTKKRKTGQETKQEAEASRAELELLTADDMGADTNLKGYNLKPKKSKQKKGKAIPDEGKIPTPDYNDPRFSSLLTSPLFALDPTDPQFKRSAAYARQITQKHKMGDEENEGQRDQSEIPGHASMHKGENIASDGLSQRKEKNELSSLVRSIKMKSNQIPLPSKHKVSWKYKKFPVKTKIQK
ncbi:pre-rRNA-processing protein esf1 [Phtheirospermum japonicum]|uniref:Pre-rRNA-processing protein esf1 n=1 Tax=Phtheirospermum japonicum TaxID=374723 RepID=A0A830B9Z6_9LAMI|nr:pre-rRNA-processing protein esf1 [Phtheirospermum japonicum]